MTGASAQEEDLCRTIPALFPHLQLLSYPLDPTAVPPCTTATIQRHAHSYQYRRAAIPVVVITAAAVDARPPFTKNQGYRADLRRRTHLVLSAAHARGCRRLILGAWGCGVFANDDIDVAQAFCDVLALPEWRYRFDVVVFAMTGRRSLSVFQSTLEALTK